MSVPTYSAYTKMPTFGDGYTIGNGWWAFKEYGSVLDMEQCNSCIDSSEAAVLSDTLARTVRIIVEPHKLLDFSGTQVTIREDMVDYLRYCILRLIRAGLTVILDAWHPDIGTYQAKFPDYVGLGPKVEPAMDYLWGYLAKRLADIPQGKLAFELKNEPWNWQPTGTDPGPDDGTVTQFFEVTLKRLCSTIRGYDRSRWIILPGKGSGIDEFVQTPFPTFSVPYMAYACHLNDGATVADAQFYVKQIATWQAAHQYPVLLTECSGTAEYMRKMKMLCFNAGIPILWHEWGLGIPHSINKYSLWDCLELLMASV